MGRKVMGREGLTVREKRERALAVKQLMDAARAGALVIMRRGGLPRGVLPYAALSDGQIADAVRAAAIIETRRREERDRKVLAALGGIES